MAVSRAMPYQRVERHLSRSILGPITNTLTVHVSNVQYSTVRARSEALFGQNRLFTPLL